MSKKELIVHEIEEVPESLLDEVLDFIHSLKDRRTQGITETALASEALLARDWMRPEEDEAWRNL